MTDAELIAKSPWEFACSWYKRDDIARSIQGDFDSVVTGKAKIPISTRSPEFAEWLTEQYRLAMTKGIELGQRSAAARLAQPTPESVVELVRELVDTSWEEDISIGGGHYVHRCVDDKLFTKLRSMLAELEKSD